jgi:hypothetical protein
MNLKKTHTRKISNGNVLIIPASASEPAPLVTISISSQNGD